ncbi:MAG: hypothetical protein WCU88_13790, partial [Elusimicrobiota bacterium]
MFLHRVRRCASLFLSLTIFSFISASAESITWTGPTNSSWFTAANWSLSRVPAAADDVLIDQNVTVLVPAGSSSISFASLTLGDAAGTFSPTLKVSTAVATNGTLTVLRNATLQQDCPWKLSFGAMSVAPGGLLTHTANTSARSYVLNLAVAGDFDLQAGATISVNGKGYSGGASAYQPGFGPGGGTAPPTHSGAGGGHGGPGGKGYDSTAYGGVVYDHPVFPRDLGSGGSSGGQWGCIAGTGGSGGGAVRIWVGGQMISNGLVEADGAASVPPSCMSAACGGGGAGGSIHITAGALSGNGRLTAKGGASRPTPENYGTPGGGGGGGRISLESVAGNVAGLITQTDGGGSYVIGGGVVGGTGTIQINSAYVPLSVADAPSNIRVSTLEERSISAAWDAVSAAAIYVLQASTSPDFSGAIISSGTAATSGTIRQLLPDTSYYLRVRAENDEEQSVFSQTISAHTLVDVTPPPAPTLIGVLSEGRRYLRISWEAASSGEPVFTFNVYRATFSFSSTAGVSPLILHSTSTVFVDRPSAEGVYYYAVTSLDMAENESSPSSSLPGTASYASILWVGPTNGSWFAAANWSLARVPAAADDVSIDENVTVLVPAGSSSISFASLTLGDAAGTFSPTLKVSTSVETGGTLTVLRNATLQQDCPWQLSFGAVNVVPGATLTHTANSSSRQYVLNLNVAGDFELQAGASVSVKGRGYSGGGQNAAGSGPGGGGGASSSGGYWGGSGAGYGGKGGVGGGWQGGPGAAGAAYGSLTDPTDLGSGGGGGSRSDFPGSVNGGAGGGAVILSVGGQMILNGTVDADGVPSLPENSYGGGGGSGGSVNLFAASISGAGSVHADGGASAVSSYP